jgi:hypothetical protein
VVQVVLVGLGFSFVLQLRFIEARPACILCFAAGENVIFHFPGSNSKKNYLTRQLHTEIDPRNREWHFLTPSPPPPESSFSSDSATTRIILTSHHHNELAAPLRVLVCGTFSVEREDGARII